MLGGVILGSIAAFAALGLLRSQLYGVEGMQLSVAASGIGLLMLAAFIAAVLRAWRVARIEPMDVLRQ